MTQSRAVTCRSRKARAAGYVSAGGVPEWVFDEADFQSFGAGPGDWSSDLLLGCVHSARACWLSISPRPIFRRMAFPRPHRVHSRCDGYAQRPCMPSETATQILRYTHQGARVPVEPPTATMSRYWVIHSH